MTDPPPEAADILAKAEAHDGRPFNASLTLAYHPRLLNRFAVLAGLFLTHSHLPRRDVELVTLRTAYRSRSEYYFGHHVLLGRAAGITDEEISAVTGQGTLHGHDALLMTATDELVSDGELTDDTWDALSDVYDEGQLMEVVLLVGFYRMIGGFAATVGLERESGIPGSFLTHDPSNPHR